MGFLSPEEAAEPSKVTLGEPEEHPPGLIQPNGEINWNCPCLGGMAVGPCGVEFREAFSCFHYSEADPKGSDCIEKFSDMQNACRVIPNCLKKENLIKKKFLQRTLIIVNQKTVHLYLKKTLQLHPVNRSEILQSNK